MKLSAQLIGASLLIYLLGYTGVFDYPRNFAQYLANPIQYGLYEVASSIENAFSFFANLKQLRDENIALLEKTYDLQSKISKLKEIEAENKSLKEQLGVKPELISQNLLLTKVIGIPFDNEDAELLIDKGSEDGIRLGQSVVYKSILVGSVVDVFAHRSNIVLVTSPKLSAAVLNQSTEGRAKGIVTGNYGTSVLMDKVLQDEEIKPGDVIVTSGQDGVFKPGLLVGTVKEVIGSTTEPVKKAKLESVINLEKLELVFIDLDSGK